MTGEAVSMYRLGSNNSFCVVEEMKRNYWRDKETVFMELLGKILEKETKTAISYS